MEGLLEDVETGERALILRIQAGDKEAFGVLVDRYMRQAYSVAVALVGSHDDALDLSQEAFVRAFRARQKIDADRPFYAWFYQILRRLCFNHIRDRKNRRRIMDSASPWLVEDSRAHAPDPARELERKDLRERLEMIIGELPEREREVLVLKEFEGLKYREIADLLGIPIGTVMSRLYSARRSLAARWKESM